jgi:hypothetical protein
MLSQFITREAFAHFQNRLLGRSLKRLIETVTLLAERGIELRSLKEHIDTQKSRVGITRSDVVCELFFTDLPPHAFTVSDVVELYLHRGAFEPALADEDLE